MTNEDVTPLPSVAREAGDPAVAQGDRRKPWETATPFQEPLKGAIQLRLRRPRSGAGGGLASRPRARRARPGLRLSRPLSGAAFLALLMQEPTRGTMRAGEAAVRPEGTTRGCRRLQPPERGQYPRSAPQGAAEAGGRGRSRRFCRPFGTGLIPATHSVVRLLDVPGTDAIHRSSFIRWKSRVRESPSGQEPAPTSVACRGLRALG